MPKLSKLLKLCGDSVHDIQQYIGKEDVITLNENQCRIITKYLEGTIECTNKIFAQCANPILFCDNFDLLLKDLYRVVEKAKLLVEDCCRAGWCQATLFQIHNEEAFQDLFMDLKCCHDDILKHAREKLSWNDELENWKSLEFSPPTLREVKDDQLSMIKRLHDLSISNAQGLKLEDLRLATYLLQTYENASKGGCCWQIEVDGEWGWGQSTLIGGGTYGKVHQTSWLGIPCAQKQQSMNSNVKDGDKLFKNEVAILASASHPNVVKFICCGQKPSKNLCFIAMELLETNLEDLMEKLSSRGSKSPFTIEVAIDIMSQIAKGMKYLHDEKKIAHRDLKPANVLVCRLYKDEELYNGNYVNVKVADFGCSKLDVDVENSSILHEGVGTRNYRAPEMWYKRGIDNLVNACEADVYSFGVICFNILFGGFPFEGMDTFPVKDLCRKLMSDATSYVPNHCREELISLIKECLALQRTKRPNFREICQTLEDLKSSILRKVSIKGKGLKSETSILERLANKLPQNVKYFCKQFWSFSIQSATLDMVQNEFERAKKRPRYVAQIWPQLRLLPSQVRSTTNLPSLPTHFIQLNETVSNVLLQLEATKIMGIIGMGGIGKSTLAKVVLHRVHKEFEATSFMEDMKDKNNVMDLQAQLLKDLKYTKPIRNKDEGLKILKSIFETKKVFVVFDDVGYPEQLNMLVSPTWAFSNGSKMIATSRNWQNLKGSVSNVGKWKMEFLGKKQSKELFYKHAFHNQPPQFEEVANKIVELCAGLPLTLEVMGSYLHGVQRPRVWANAMKRLQMGKPLGGGDDNERLWKTLRISYDDLNKEEKHLFLDIACFFCHDVLPSGMHEEMALQIWSGNDIEADLALFNLLDRCLVRIDMDGTLAMHDQLRDMGRMIAKEEHVLRIWDVNDVSFPNRYKMVFPHVEGLYIDGSITNWKWNINMNVDGLRLLNIVNCKVFISIYELLRTSSKLNWMRVCMLGGEYGEVEELPKPFFSQLNDIRVLELTNFNKVTCIPNDIHSLRAVQTIIFSRWYSLKELPSALGNLSSLVTLDLSHCETLKELPSTLGNLSSLVTLKLDSCHELEELPSTLGNLSSLVTLKLDSCHKLEELPSTLGNLSSLVTLDLSWCWTLKELPSTLGNLSSLVTLKLDSCDELEELPSTLGNLSSLLTLKLSLCRTLKELPSTLGNLSSLVTLKLDSCHKLEELPSTLGNLSLLVTLDLCDCETLKELPNTLGDLSSLVTLNLNGCNKLEEISSTLGNLSSLVTLDLSRCRTLQELPSTLDNLSSLVTLDLSWCWTLKELPSTLGNLSSLVTLDLYGCATLKELPSTLGNLSSLVTLDLSLCRTLKELPSTLGNLSSLVTLKLDSCHELEELPSTLGNLSSLVTLKLDSCHKLEELPSTLGNLSSLVTLDLSWCWTLKELPSTLGNLSSLVTLKLDSCDELEELPSTLGNLSSLLTLKLSLYRTLKELPSTLGNLSSLVTLKLDSCHKLEELPSTLGNLSSLVTLDLYDCATLKELPSTLGNLSSLVTLDLSLCRTLKELPSTLGNLSSLVTLNLYGCDKLEELPSTLGNLSSFVTLNLYGCDKLEELPSTFGNLPCHCEVIRCRMLR